MNAVDFQPIILAGGVGERFWPLSTPERPKQLLSFDVSGKSLLQQTIERLRLVSDRPPWVQTSRPLLRAIQAHLSERAIAARVFAEPGRRDTGPAIAWSTQKAQAELGDDAVIGYFPADPWIPDGPAFAACAREAAAAATALAHIVTIGIAPSRPETGYGYIEAGPTLTGKVLAVKRFHEKPDAVQAQRYLEAGRYYWNAGMFVARAGVMAGEFAAHAPDIWRPLAEQGERGYEALPKLSVDYAVMEKSKQVAVLPSTFAWDDLGDWAALKRLPPGWAPKTGEHLDLDSHDLIVYNDVRNETIATLGLKDVVVVRTHGKTLVMSLASAQKLKNLLPATRD